MKTRVVKKAGLFVLMLSGFAFVLLYFKEYKRCRIVTDLSALSNKKNLIPVAIIGAGPAGLSAAIFTARAKFSTAIFTGSMVGGQIAEASYIENWPGLDKESGEKTIERVKKQAEHFGAKIVETSVERIDCSSWPFKLYTSEHEEINALVIILAMGGNQKTLPIEGVKEYFGKGIGICSICDAPFDQDKQVAVIGGGDTAADKALQSAAYAQHVTILVNKDRMHATAVIQDYLKAVKNISIKYNTTVAKIIGDGSNVTHIELVDIPSGKHTKVPMQRLYFALGFEPNVALVKNLVTLTPEGYVKTYYGTHETSLPGIFAAGNIEDNRYQKASVAAGRGVSSALDAIEFLESIGFSPTVAEQYSKNFYQPKKE